MAVIVTCRHPAKESPVIRAEEFMRDPGLMLNILLPEDRERVAPHFLGESGSDDPLLLEFRIRRRDGETIWIEHACRPVHDDSGRFLGRRASNRDISEHKRLAAELAQARDQAEAANRAKSVFLANMSHELRTPLNAILGFAQLMERDAQLSPEQRRNLATIHRSGHHLLDLINDVLDISRIEAGRTTIQAAPFDLDDTLARDRGNDPGARRRQRPRFRRRTCRAVPRYVNGDAPRLRQVLAQPAVQRGQIYRSRRRAPAHRAGWEAGRLRFEVIDTGPGIPNAEQQRIFEAFYQTSAGAAKGEGAGLGLAISREYTRLMGGELGMRSEAGEGSTFFCILPLPEVAGSLAESACRTG
jgi:signal transduction histidine kinase